MMNDALGEGVSSVELAGGGGGFGTVIVGCWLVSDAKMTSIAETVQRLDEIILFT